MNIVLKESMHLIRFIIHHGHSNTSINFGVIILMWLQYKRKVVMQVIVRCYCKFILFKIHITKLLNKNTIFNHDSL